MPGKEFLGYALTNDHDTLGAVAVGISKIAALENGYSQSLKKSGRDGTESCAPIILTIQTGGAVHGEGETDVQRPGVSPGNAETGRHVFDAGESTDASLNVTIELTYLRGGSAGRHDG